MSPKSILSTVKARYPELEKLPRAKLRIVEKAIVYARNLATEQDLLSPGEHRALLKEIGPKKGLTPATRLKAYRLREGLTQKQLAKKTGVSQTNLSAMEKAKRPIGLNVAKKLARVLKCHYKKLI